MTDLDARAFRKSGKHLTPSDPHAEEFIDAIPDGKEVLVSIRRPRNVQHHRFFFAKLRAIVEATGKWLSEDDLLQDLKLATRHVEKRQNVITKDYYMAPRSINFASMSQDAFARFNDRCDYVLAEAGIDVDAIMAHSGISSPAGRYPATESAAGHSWLPPESPCRP